VEDILSLARKAAEQAEVYQVFSTTTPVHFEGSRLKQVQTKESTSTALRLIKGGRIGFAQANGFIKPGRLVDMAKEACPFGMPARFSFPGKETYPTVEVFDPRTETMAIEDMVQVGEQLIAAVRQHTPDVVCEASVVKGTSSVRIMNSEGGNVSYRKSFFVLGIEGTLVKGEDILFVGDSQHSCRPITDFSAIAQEVIQQLELTKRNAGISTMAMPVIFTPQGVASALISILASAFNGKMVLDGASPLKDKQGNRAFDERFSLWDDATLPCQVASCPCDDEGVTSQRTPLIENGVVSNFLYDLQTAALANRKSTGNGERRGGLPSPSPSSLVISEGSVSFSDMVRSMKQGLVVDQLMGAEQGNILNGDFSGNVLLGYKVENGEIAGRVKNTMVYGNAYQALEHLEAIGREARWVGGFLRTPCLHFSSLSVATKAG